ncbi:unnamed protein product [Zymoseptoria tritici ST99CH_3D7]|uniref:Uncharacterized protein n=1 Tax=Zymoseptoria tritici (strain ST99CH_3D7) TaxID=1276538 RepID=A0A1X7S5B0_ZYMT9|nr:unnamed protein product [Zymoseptoria tritici ST99CH_3D7]
MHGMMLKGQAEIKRFRHEAMLKEFQRVERETRVRDNAGRPNGNWTEGRGSGEIGPKAEALKKLDQNGEGESGNQTWCDTKTAKRLCPTKDMTEEKSSAAPSAQSTTGKRQHETIDRNKSAVPEHDRDLSRLLVAGSIHSAGEKLDRINPEENKKKELYKFFHLTYLQLQFRHDFLRAHRRCATGSHGCDHSHECGCTLGAETLLSASTGYAKTASWNQGFTFSVLRSASEEIWGRRAACENQDCDSAQDNTNADIELHHTRTNDNSKVEMKRAMDSLETSKPPVVEGFAELTDFQHT